MSTGPENAKVLVIGSGFAGLAAASKLIEAGFEDVLVLEAKERVGGRVHTTKPFTENIIEVGANWIHGQKGNPLYKIAKEKNLLSEGPSVMKNMCLPHSVSPRDYFFNEDGKPVPKSVVDQVCARFSKLTDKAFDDELDGKYRKLTLGAYLDDAFGGTELSKTEDARQVYEWCKRVECTDEACSSLYEISASQLSNYTELEGGFINDLGFGIVNKIFLFFEKSFWPDDCAGVQLVWKEGPEDKDVYEDLSEGEDWKQTWFKKITGFDTVARHPTALCGWITGREALYMESLQDREIQEV